MKRLHTDVKYTEGYRIQPGDIVEIIGPTKERVGVYVAMDGYKGYGGVCSRCVISSKNTDNTCPMPFDNNGWRLCSITYVFFRHVEDVLEDL